MYDQHPYNNPYYRPYPAVDISTFEKSVEAFPKTFEEARTILKKLSERKFASQLMSLAQQGKQREVDDLIKTIGTHSPVTTDYTPDGIRLTIHETSQGSPCCALTMSLRWGSL